MSPCLLLLSACLVVGAWGLVLLPQGWHADPPPSPPNTTHPTAAPVTPAQFRLASAFSSDMVLQMAPKSSQIWGFGQPFAEIVLTFNESAFVTTVSREGRWSVRLPPQPAGGPHTISVEHVPLSLCGPTTEELTGVMFGDVWLCSGGSNMAQELHAVAGWQEAVERARKLTNLRVFQARRLAAPAPLEEGGVAREWQTTAEDVLLSYFPALCLFYGMQLAELLPQRPIGLVEAAWGGTPIQSWASPRVLGACREHARGHHPTTQPPHDEAVFHSHAGEHSRVGHHVEPHHVIPPFLTSHHHDPHHVIPPFVTSHHTDPHHAATPHVLPPRNLQPVHHVTSQGGGAPHHVEPQHAAGHVVSHVFVAVHRTGQQETTHQAVHRSTDQYSDHALWNGMIYPLTRLAMRGAIWHQGEANTALEGESYACVLSELIRDWQRAFLDSDVPVPAEQGMHFPFGYVQLGPSRSSRQSAWGSLRLQQSFADSLFNLPGQFLAETFTAPAYDLIDAPDVEVTGLGAHYRDKARVADRLALAAQQLMYNASVDATGPAPLLDQIKVDKELNLLNITFSKEIQVRGPEGFFLENAEGEMVPAEIRSSWSRGVSLELLPGARHVAYAWGALPCEHARCAVYSLAPEGHVCSLPAVPFKAPIPLDLPHL